MNRKILGILVLIIMMTKISSAVNGCDYIYDMENKMSFSDKESLCNEIKTIKDKTSFIIIVRLQYDVPNKDKYTTVDSACDADNQNFLINQISYSNRPKGIVITVYYGLRKIRISVGEESNRAIDMTKRNIIINEIKNYLKYDNFIEAFRYSVRKCSTYIDDYKRGSSGSSSSSGGVTSSAFFWIGIIFGIIALVICISCIVKKSSNNNSSYIESKNTRLIGDNSIQTQIHNHVTTMLGYVKTQIRNNNPPITSIDNCIICMNNLNPNWENEMNEGNRLNSQMNQGNQFNNNYNNNNFDHNFNYPGQNAPEVQNIQYPIRTNSHLQLTRFNCGHFYHTSCLNSKGIDDCIMCKNIQLKIAVEPSYRYFNTVDENNILNALQQLERIYQREELRNYAHNYNNDIIIVKEVYPTYGYNYYGPSVIWIDDPYIPPPIIIHNDYGHSYSNHSYGHNDYYSGGGGNVYSSGGDYGNSNNDYGGGGDYGGGDYGGGGVSSSGGDY